MKVDMKQFSIFGKKDIHIQEGVVTFLILVASITIISLIILKRKKRKQSTDNNQQTYVKHKVQTAEELINSLEQNGFVRLKSYRPNQEQDIRLYNDELHSVKMFKSTYPQAKGFVCYADFKECVPYIGICDPDMIHEFMVDKEKYYERDITVSYVARILGDSLLFNLSDVWRMKRKIYGQMFHFYQYNSLISLVRQISTKTTSIIDLYSYQPVKLINYFEDILGEWSLHLFFGSNANKPDLQQCLRTQYNNARSAIMLLQPENITNCLAPLKDILLEFLQSTSEQIKQDPDYQQKPQNNITWYLMNSKDVRWEKEFLDQICQDITIFFFAGRDTMAHTLQMLFYYLCIHPQYKKLIDEEIKNLKGDYSVQNISQMKYLEATIKETLRFYGPTTTILPKVAMERHTLLDNKICIEEGTIVSLALQELNYDPLYYPEPDKFQPERWFDEKLKQKEKKIFMPFSYGSHKCIGDKLALPIMKMLYITLAETYELNIDPSFKLKLIALIQYTPLTPVPFILKRKQNNQY